MALTFGPGINLGPGVQVRSVSATGQLNGVASGLSEFLAVGSAEPYIGTQGIWYTSSNGTTWSNSSAISGGSFAGVASNGSLFVAVGGTGAVGGIAYSNDGLSWTPATVPGAPDTIRSVAYGDGVWCAVGWDTALAVYIATSTDGISWTQQSSGALSGFAGLLYSVSYDNGQWFAAGTYGYIGTPYCLIFNSAAAGGVVPTTWTQQFSGVQAGYLLGISTATVGPTTWTYAVGTDNTMTNSIIVFSYGTGSWFTSGVASAASVLRCVDINSSTGNITAGGSTTAGASAIYTSNTANSSVWTSQSGAYRAASSVNALAYAGVYVAVGQTTTSPYTNLAWYSADGITWTQPALH